MKSAWGGLSKSLVLAGVVFSATAMAATPIQFNFNGTGNAGAVSVGSFDWLQGNAINLLGAPAGGLVLGSQMELRSHSKLNSAVAPDGHTLIPVPAGMELTFVHGMPVVVDGVFGPNSAHYTLDTSSQVASEPNFIEIWVSAPDSNMLAGTNFNNGKRILYGRVLGGAGVLSVSTGPTACAAFGGTDTTQFDQFPSPADNNYPGQLTVCATGSGSISVDVLAADAGYFPGFGPTSIATLKTFFNTSNITPFNQQDPSAQFVDNDAGFAGNEVENTIAPDLGPVNGQVTADKNRDFQNQADANQSFQPGTVVAGTCRVTYGGNDSNGNTDPTSFGAACSSDKGKAQNCYTFGGQVGAPTADPTQGGPFGEHTHHNVSGPAGDFVFRAGTHSAPKSTRITATACKDPDACQPAAANALFKQIDFEGTGTFRTLDPTATAYLSAQAGHAVVPDNQDSTTVYYFRVDMDDLGEPGNQPSSKHPDTNGAKAFFADDVNNPLATADPSFFSYFADKKTACTSSADVYQILICRDATPCGPGTGNPDAPIYAVRGFLTGGNIQIHPIIK